MVGAIGHPSLPGRSKSLPGVPKTLSGSIRTFSWAQGLFGTSVRPPKTNQDHEHRRKWTHMARYGLRICVFEAHRHFLSIATPSDPKSHREIVPNPHFPKNQRIRKIGIPPGVGGNGRSPFTFQTKQSFSVRKLS